MPMNKTQISRVTRTKEQAKASYNIISKWYDLLASPSERKYRAAGLQKLCAKEGEAVLEIGFGTGNDILTLAQSVGISGTVCGIDISEGMCDIAKSRIRKAGLSGRVRLDCSDAVRLPYNDNFFDAIYMSFTLELFDTPEIPVVLHECSRVLRTGGRICVVAMSKKEKAGVMVRLYEWSHIQFPNYVDCRPIFVQKALENAGFQILDVTEMSMWGLPVEIVMAMKE
jgi:ubiquinone/menaquinone biosynthesis C-methylase UbiE